MAALADAAGFPLVADLGSPVPLPVPGSGQPSALWVGDLGVCRVCDGLAVRGVCSSCESEARRENFAERVRVRPFCVSVEVGDAIDGIDEPDDWAVLQVPDHASDSAKLVAKAVVHIATFRLLAGDTLDFALCKVALGRDSVKKLLDVWGTPLDRKTIGHALDELVELGVLDRVGQ